MKKEKKQAGLSSKNRECREVFVVTVVWDGLENDTEVHLCQSHEEAEQTAREIMDDLQMADIVEGSVDLWIGKSNKGRCDAEVEIHSIAAPKWMTIAETGE